MYSQYAKDFPSRLKVVGVAEPKDVRRVSFQKRFSIEDQNVFITWKDVSIMVVEVAVKLCIRPSSLPYT